MEYDPFSRPTRSDLQYVREYFAQDGSSRDEQRTEERLELEVPAEIKTARGNIVEAMTRNISRTGIGLLHRGSLTPEQEIILTMTSDTRAFTYKVLLLWCQPCNNGMFISGGKFIHKL